MLFFKPSQKMSDSNETAGFWLPSEFFTDDDFLTENENLKNTTTTTAAGSGFRFQNEFPYHLETKTHENLKNCWVMSTSPQSTLAHHRSWSSRSTGGSSNGSPQGVPSPPTTPLGDENDAVRDLVFKAAGQFASLSLGSSENFVPGPTKHNGFLDPHNVFAQHPKNPSPSFVHNSQFPQGSGMYQSRSERVMGKMGQSGWTIQQNPTRFVVGSCSGGAVKKTCAGTGVFLPRSYGNTKNESNACTSDSRKKPGCSFGLVPDKTANLVYSQSQPVSQPQFDQGFIRNYESLIARRNLIMSQRRALLLAERSLLMNGDMYLPQEWTY